MLVVSLFKKNFPRLLAAFVGILFLPQTSRLQAAPLPELNIPGEWNLIRPDEEDFCEYEEIKSNFPACNKDSKLIRISYYDDYPRALMDFNDRVTLDYILGNITRIAEIDITDKVIVQIDSANSCGPLFVNSNYKQPEEPLIYLSNISDCDNTRSTYTNTYNFSLPKNFRYDRVKEALEGTKLVSDYGMQIVKHNENLYHIFNPIAKRNVLIKGKNLWERISILLVLDKENNRGTLIIDGYYKGGIGNTPPNLATMLPINADYHGSIFALNTELQAALIQ